MPRLTADVLGQYRYCSQYNSPYPAHDAGCAVDLYPDGERAPSPVAGEVVGTRTVRAPPKPYAAEHDHVIVVDTGEYLARVMHVAPGVAAGDTVAVGDDLGPTVRAGFFAPWVENHLHVGFRHHDQHPYRASGSLPLTLAIDVEPLDWDGTGTVVETGETYALLDAPAHPAPGGDRWVGLAADEGGVVDGGLVHYAGGGLHGGSPGPVSLLGQRVGTASAREAGGVHDCAWADVAVFANGERVTGLSLFVSRTRFGAKLICPDHGFAVGDYVRVTLAPTADPVHLRPRV